MVSFLSIRGLFLFFIFLFMLNIGYSQSLRPDSIMNKMEDFGNFLLYKNHDTTFISNQSDKFTLKLVGINKINYYKLRDGNKNTTARYRPDRRLNLGIGFSYKWFALDLTFNVGITEDSDFENSKALDFQGVIFSSKQYIAASYQYYYGYQISKFTGVPPDEIPNSNIRDDIRTIHFGLDYFFAFNYDKFSLKAPFIHNEVQLKSAGSALLGASFNLFVMNADSSIVPSELSSDFDEKLQLTSLNSSSLAVSFGYMYTFVWKEHFYITLSLLPALGVNIGDYSTDYSRPFNTHLYVGLGTNNSIGYNGKKIFGGIQFYTDAYNTRIDKKLNVTTGYGKIRFFVGWRFGKS